MENEEKMNQEISNLKKKYDAVIQRIDHLEKENKETSDSMKRIESGFSMMNNNFDELMKKLDTIVEDKEVNNMFHDSKKSNMSLKSLVTKPMRKLAVGAMSAVFCITDYTSEKMSYAREGMEDMIAEAHYKSRAKKANRSDQMTPNMAGGES